MKLGCFLSNSKGYRHMLKEALYAQADTFQFFTRNPRGGNAKALDPVDIAEYNRLAAQNDIGPIMAHSPYTLNPCAARPDIREFTINTMKDDLARLKDIPGVLYNFHPGSHVGQGPEEGIRLIAESLNEILTEDTNPKILLETMSGKGSEVGRTFEELKQIMDMVELKDKLGVCMDTCHVYDAGYNIVEDLDGVLEEFDRIIGIDKLYGIHLNDSKNPYASHKDRHEKIGQGSIGLEGFSRILNHPVLKNLPFYLETPNELDGYKEEIALLRSLCR